MSDLVKIAQLIAMGISQTQVAAAIGVTDGRLSQLLTDNKELQTLIQTHKSELAVNEVAKVISMEQIERNLIQKIDGLVEEVPSLGEAVGALERLVKLRAIKAAGETVEPTKRPTIFIGKLIQQQINVTLTAENEIAALGNRSMATMPTKQVLNLIKDNKEAKALLNLPNFIPKTEIVASG